MIARTDGGRRRWTISWFWILALLLLLVVAANIHLVYVAVNSQPECVPHLKEAGKNGNYRAAKSAC
jgi:hypothetical protein